jgi:hypothetical protein
MSLTSYWQQRKATRTLTTMNTIDERVVQAIQEKAKTLTFAWPHYGFWRLNV